MTKSLSLQLCKLCGIKPKVTIHKKYVQDEFGTPMYKNTRQKQYPDFEDPENFVKLLDIVSRRAEVSFLHKGPCFGCEISTRLYERVFTEIDGRFVKTVQVAFLWCLLKQNRLYCRNRLLDELYYHIRNAQWKWG